MPSKAEIKKMRDEFKKTGELPDHLKKLVKGKKDFEKRFKVKDVVIPGMEWMSKLGEERDYKDEYKKFQSSTKSKKYRAELNKYNRKKGTYGNGDGKDASHKGGKIVGFESESKNRGRAEKSRLKKEGMLNENPAAMAAASAMVKIKMKNPKTGKESSAASALKNKDNPNHKKAKGIFGKLKDRFAKKKKEEPKKQSKADGDFYKRQYEAKNTPEIFEKYRTVLVVAFRKAGILVKKIKPMKKGFTNAAFGVFFDVKAANGSDTIPIYIDKKGMVELGVSSKGFVIGRIDQMAKMIKNLKDFKKSDLDESVNEGKFGKFDTGAGFKGNGMTIYDRNQDKGGDFKNIAHIGEDGKITIYDKNVKKEPKLMQSLNKISQEFKKTFKESVNEGKLSEDYKNSEWEVYVADENGKEKIVKKAKSKRAGVILYNKLINSDNYYEVGMRVVKESVNEANNIDKIKDILKNKSMKKISGVMVDMQTANAIVTVHKALGQSNRKKFEKLPIKKMASVAWKLVK